MKTVKSEIDKQLLLFTEMDVELEKVASALGKRNTPQLPNYTSVKKLMKKYPASLEVILMYIDFLLLNDGKKLLNQFCLEDIENLFRQLVKRFPYHYVLHLDYYYFLFNVMDKERQATKLLKKCIWNNRAQIKKMEKIVS